MYVLLHVQLQWICEKGLSVGHSRIMTLGNPSVGKLVLHFGVDVKEDCIVVDGMMDFCCHGYILRVASSIRSTFSF